MVQILGRITSNNVQKVIWLLDELDVPYERHDYGGPFGKTQTPEYLVKNPHGLVPTLIDGDLVLWESNTILRYMANKHPSTLYPPGLEARAQVEKWMDWQLGTLSPTFRPLYLALVREGTTIAENRDSHQAAARCFDRLERSLETSAYIAGPRMTLADIAIGPMLHRWFKLGLDQSRAPRLKLLLDELCKRPAFATVALTALA